MRGERKRERKEGRDNEEGEGGEQERGGDGEIQQGMRVHVKLGSSYPALDHGGAVETFQRVWRTCAKGISSLNNHHMICERVYYWPLFTVS